MNQKKSKSSHVAQRVSGSQMTAVLLAVASVFFSSLLFAAPFTDEAYFAKLKGRVIRSMAVAPFNANVLIIGNKGPNAGDGTLFISRDGGVNWRFLNNNRPLGNAVTDVQAVAMPNAQTLLAGTWKNGLFRSSDGGQTFVPVKAFPSKDVRSIAVSGASPAIVFAATSDQGVLRSTDAGQTWSATSLGSGFIWSVRTHQRGKLLSAGSQSGGLYLSRDDGASWSRSLSSAKVYEADLAPSGSNRVAVAAEDGLYISNDWQSDSAWVKPTPLEGRRLSSVRFSAQDPDTVLAGDWAGGIWEYSLKTKKAIHHYSNLPVVHLESTAETVFAGSWGRGLHVFPQLTNNGSLINATKQGDAVAVKQLLNEGVAPNETDAYHNTALIFASRDGFSGIVNLLIDNQADVNWIDGEGVTPLILASYKNHPDIVETLLSKGADTTVVDHFGRTAIDYARRRGESDAIFEMLLATNTVQ